VQFEAAYVYFDQGLVGKTDFLKKAVDGVNRGQKGEVWGWTELSTRLQRLIADGRTETRDRYGDKLYEAWYNASLCRQKLGQAQPTTAKKQAELEISKSVIETFVRITVDIPDDWWKKFDRLYRQIQSDLGQAPKPLERPTTLVIAAAPAKPKVEKTETAKVEKKKAKAEAAEAPKSSGGGAMAVVIFVLILVGGGGTSVWMVLQQKKHKRPERAARESSDVVFSAAPDLPAAGPVFDMTEAATRRKATVTKKNVRKPTRPKDG